MNIRFLLSLYISKIFYFFIKLSNRGSGYTWPGEIALHIDPNFLANSNIRFTKGLTFISGTNGKTTTTLITTSLLKANGTAVISNPAGGNILNGIASSLVREMDLFGNLPDAAGVFEVDELTLPKLLRYLQPNNLVLLNLSRDQLDRHGEIDLVVEKWHSAISKLNKSTNLILSKDSKYFASIINDFKGAIYYFDDSSTYLALTNFAGSFNAKNLNASITLLSLNLSLESLTDHLPNLAPAYGRGEKIHFRDTEFIIFLAKNPASLNNNLSLISELSPDAVLFVLNDEIRDGRDVSWIYDINPTLLKDSCVSVSLVTAGTRYLDMSVRLTYAGLGHMDSKANLAAAIDELAHSSHKRVLVFPNYSAMLAVRKILLGKHIL
ncbi:MAG: MurT ligase domain-containing protein [Patescibacteria group bacterium]